MGKMSLSDSAVEGSPLSVCWTLLSAMDLAIGHSLGIRYPCRTPSSEQCTFHAVSRRKVANLITFKYHFQQPVYLELIWDYLSGVQVQMWDVAWWMARQRCSSVKAHSIECYVSTLWKSKLDDGFVLFTKATLSTQCPNSLTTILFKFIARRRLLLKTVEGTTATAFRRFQINAHYSYSSLFLQAEYSHRKEFPSTTFKSSLQLQLHESCISLLSNSKCKDFEKEWYFFATIRWLEFTRNPWQLSPGIVQRQLTVSSCKIWATMQ